MLHLVGETIDKHRAQYGVETGKLVQVMRGIYVAADDDADAVLFDHALRIAAYLYPSTYLCGASAELLAPTPDRRLFLGSNRNERTRLCNLEIVQTRAPHSPETEQVETSDSLGEFRTRRSTLRFRYLESFRRRSEAGAAMPTAMQSDIAARLVDTAGDTQSAVIECWRLAEANGWRKEAGRAEAFIVTPLREAAARSKTLHVGWHGEQVGVLAHDGSAWRWDQTASESAIPVRAGAPGSLPPFIDSLLPEGWLARVLKPKSELDRVAGGKRYMSNIVISANTEDLQEIPSDVLEGRLESFARDGVFTGGYEGPTPAFEQSLEDRMAETFASAQTPRLSGVQIKMPMNLSTDGLLRPAVDRAFTHILKPSPGAGFEELPRVEAACLTAALACGFETPAHALVPMPGGLPDALLVERFDIRRDHNDLRKIALEDMASVRGVAPTEKYEGSIEQAARALRGVSSDVEADIATLLARAIFAWLIADGDFHLKNMAVLKVIPEGASNFSSVRLAPVYDAVTTRVFPGLEHDNMALALEGKRNQLTSGDFARTGATMGIRAGEVRNLIESLCGRLNTHIAGLDLSSQRVAQAIEIWKKRIVFTAN